MSDAPRIRVAYINFSRQAGLFGPVARLWAETDDGRSHHVFSFYPEEGSVSPKSFLGLTMPEGRQRKPGGLLMP